MHSSPFALLQRGILLAVILLFVVPAAWAQAMPATNDAWQTYNYPMDGFAIDAPVQPQFSKMDQATDAGKAILHNYVIVVGDSALMVSVTNVGSLLDGQDPDTILQGGKSGAINNTHGLLQPGAEKKISLGGYHGLEFEWDGESSGSRLHFFERIYIVGGYLYQTLVVTPEGTTYPDAVRFHNSFQLVENK
jgi:hypothetical protein